MPTSPAAPASLSSSVQTSETSHRPLRARNDVHPWVRNATGDGREPPLWEETASQRHVHARFRPLRLLVLDAMNGSEDPKLKARTRRMEACCVAPIFALKSDGRVGVVPGFCRDRMCPLCQHHRGRDVAIRVNAAVLAMNAPRFLTLTLKHTDAPLTDQLDRLYQAFRDLRKRPEWKAHVAGGIGTLEVKRSECGRFWHPHLHLLIDGTFWAHKDIKVTWERVTGDSSIVWIEAVHDRSRAANYISTYVAKPADVAGWQTSWVCEYALALAGRRLVISFGVHYGSTDQADDCGTKAVAACPLASAAAVLRAVSRECRYGHLARQLLCRVGGLPAKAVGHTPERDAPKPVPLTPAEWSTLAIALKRIGGDGSAWLPEIEPERRFNGRSHAGRTCKVATMRLFTQEDADVRRGAYASP